MDTFFLRIVAYYILSSNTLQTSTCHDHTFSREDDTLSTHFESLIFNLRTNMFTVNRGLNHHNGFNIFYTVYMYCVDVRLGNLFK